MHAVKGDGFTSRPGSSSGGGIGPGGAMRGSRSGSTLGSRGAASEGGMGEQMEGRGSSTSGTRDGTTRARRRGVGDSRSPRPLLSLSAPRYEQMNYEIREDRDGNVYVKDLALISVSSYDEVIAVINQGLKLRATHETKMNAVSSRSHTVFTITVVQRDRATGEAVSGKLNLVDLAGSER